MSLQFSSPVPNIELNVPRANLSCSTCRRQKRRCDKALPACSLCTRMNRVCDYSAPTSTPTSDEFNALRQQVFELERELKGRLAGSNGSAINESSPYTPATTLSGSSEHAAHTATPATVYLQQDPAYSNVQNRFPAIAFLDSEAFKYGQIAVPKATVDIPIEVLEILGDGAAVQAVITDYFQSVHTWMPIVSKKRMSRNMLNPMWEAGADLALLFLAMKLIICRPQEGLESSQNPIYQVAKRFISLMEASGAVSLLVLQAHILVSLYEISMAVYPAAWMSSGASIRYALLLGVNKHEEVPQLLGGENSWTEHEERLRCWWAALVIDRIVSLGGEGRGIQSEDPSPNLSLPVDTLGWDEGEMTSSPRTTTDGGFNEPKTPFARLCQASILLGKVIRHHYLPLTPESHQFQHASDLYLEASELARILTNEAESSHDYLLHAPGLAICLSTLATLCDPYACTGHRAVQSHSAEEAAMLIQAIEGIKSVSENTKNFADRIIEHTSHSLDIDRVSPLIMDALYSSAANFAWIVRESGDETSQIGLESIRGCLRRLASRYRSAEQYLRILEAQEFTYAVGGNTGS